MNVLEVRLKVCPSACVCVSLVGHVAYVSLTLWVTEKPSSPSLHHPPSPPLFHKHASAHARKEGREGVRKEQREGQGGGGGGGEGWGCMQVYDNTQTDALVENSLNCKQGSLPGIQESKYRLIRGCR